MPITIRCPNPDCGRPYQVHETSLGGRATCKKCSTTFTIEMQAEETADPQLAAPPGLAPQKQAEPAKHRLAPAAPAQPAPAADSDPVNIGPYTVVRRLGAGAMGEVWLGYDPSLERHVAIKTLRPENAQSTHHLDRFVREAKLAARLHHTNAVTVYQMGVKGQAAYIAMEYVEGQSLDTAVAPGRPLPWSGATRAVRDAAAGRYQTAAEMQAELAALLAAPEESLRFGAPWDVLQAAPADTGERTLLTGVWSAVARSYSGAKSVVGRRLTAPAGGMGRGRVRYGALAAAGFMALLIFGLVLSIRTRHGTVKIVLSDPAADVEVKVDGETIDVVGLKEPLRLTAGELMIGALDSDAASRNDEKPQHRVRLTQPVYDAGVELARSPRL